MISSGNQLADHPPTIMKKTDIIFYKAWKRSLRNWSITLTSHFLNSLLLLFFIPYNSQPTSNQINTALIFGLVVSLLSTLLYLYAVVGIFCSVEQYLLMARFTGHLVEEERLEVMPGSIDECVSQRKYLVGNQIDQQALPLHAQDQLVKAVYQQLKVTIENQFSCFNSIQNLLIVACLVSAIYSIYTIIEQKDTATTGQTITISIYIFLELISKLFLLLVIVLFALAPILILIACIVGCCKKPPGQFIDLQKIKANVNNIADSGGECGICLDNYKYGDDVYILPCSTKHMFHQKCLADWARKNNTCPNCREPIPMTQNQRN